MTRRTRLTVGLVTAGAVLFLAAACGVPSDDSPQVIATGDLPGDLLDPTPGSSTTLPESAATTTVPVYLLEETGDGVRLVAVDREVAQADVPDDRIAALFGGATSAEVEAGTTSAIPADTELLDVTTDRESGQVTIDMSSDIFSIEGESLAQAFGQMVYTATEREAGGYRDVRFFVDGEPTTVLDGNGAEREGPVSRSDYTAIMPR